MSVQGDGQRGIPEGANAYIHAAYLFVRQVKNQLELSWNDHKKNHIPKDWWPCALKSAVTSGVIAFFYHRLNPPAAVVSCSFAGLACVIHSGIISFINRLEMPGDQKLTLSKKKNIILHIDDKLLSAAIKIFVILSSFAFFERNSYYWRGSAILSCAASVLPDYIKQWRSLTPANEGSSPPEHLSFTASPYFIF